MKCFTVKKISFSFGNDEETVVLNNTVYGGFNDAATAMRADCDVESKHPVSSNQKAGIDEKRGTAYISDYTRLISTIPLKNTSSRTESSDDCCGFRRLFEHVFGAEINVREVSRKMSREEELCRRLCGYLELTVETIRGCIVIYPSDTDWKKDLVGELVYETFHDALFDIHPYISLRNIPEWKFYTSVWDDAVRKAFNFSSLEELELQLSIRGF